MIGKLLDILFPSAPPSIAAGMTEEMYRQLQREELAYRARMTDFSDPKAREEYINYSNALAQGQKND